MKRIATKYKSLSIFLIALTLILVSSQTLFGKNYYFSTSIGDDTRTSTQAQNTSTPWKTLNKLNSFFTSLAAGDSVLLKRGDVFVGSINVAKSGTSSQPIIIGAYGSGADPVISGLTAISGWTNEGNGIYSKTISCESKTNIVTIDGVNTAMGRWPNTGFMSYESFSGNTSITDNQLTGTPNWKGAEVVIRKLRWMLDRNIITNHSSTTLTYTTGSSWTPTAGYGYFIQNSLSTLDALGEWFYNGTKLYMYFGTVVPTTKTVKISTIDRLIYINGYNYITFDNIYFEGANTYAVQNNSGKNIIIKNCTFKFSGRDGIYIDNTVSSNAYMIIDGNTFDQNNECAINLRGATNYAWIKNNTISNTGMIPGSGTNNDDTYDAITLYGANNIVEYNSITNTGHSAITVRSSNGIIIRNNYITYFGMTRYDAGGIYSYNSSPTITSRTFTKNIILNSKQTSEGIGSETNLSLFGIYLDNNSINTQVTYNTVAYCNQAGINNINSGSNTIKNNVCFDNGYQLRLVHAWGDGIAITKMVIKNNIFFSKASNQPTLYFRDDSNPFSSFGTADSNYYARPIDDNQAITTSVSGANTNRTLAGWQSLVTQDAHSKKSPISITNTADLKFEYNNTKTNKVVALSVPYIDVYGKIYSSSITIQPYSSVVLIKSLSTGTNYAPAIQNQSFQINEKSPNGTIVGTVDASDPNSGQVLTYSIISGNTNNAFTINSTSGELVVKTASALNILTTPVFSLVVKVQDNGTGTLSSQAAISVILTSAVTCSATGYITYQLWNNIGSGTAVSDLTSNTNYPNNPTSTSVLASMEAPINVSDNSGTKIAGYICAPLTGSYTFWIASNNNGELWLSTDNQSANKQRIAYHTDYTGSREWNKFTTQRSATINLIQGQAYYIEALMKEYNNSDNLAVGWLKPGQTGTVPSEVIPGSVLSPIVTSTSAVTLVSSISLPATASVSVGSTIPLTASVLPSNATNISLNWSSSNTSIASVSSNGTVTGISAGSVNITARTTDGSNKSSTCSITVDSYECSATGYITYQLWNNIGSGTAVSDLTSNTNYPNNPTSTSVLTSFEAPINVSDNFGTRIAGYICAPLTGSYTFWIASNNEGELWLSTDDQSSNKKKIAYHTNYTNSREWNKFATQKSVTINLVQGKTYYIEALMKEYNNSDNLAVGWLKPGETGTIPSEVIPGSVLSTIGASSGTIYLVSSVSLPASASVNVGSTIPLNATVLPSNATNSSLNWTSSNTSIATVNNYGTVTGIASGSANITAKSTDGSNKSSTCSVSVNSSVCSATGNVTYQIWKNISGTAVSDLTSNINYPNNPSSTSVLTAMEAPLNVSDNSGTRIAGYICAPLTGNYTFWIASNNEGELWLSTDDQAGNKQKIAYHTDYTSSREWNKYATQKSAIISLIQGKTYYIEALMKEYNNNDNLAVGWLKPGQTGTVPSEVIPGSVLSPLISKSIEDPIVNPSFSESDIKLLVYPNPLNSDVLNVKLDNFSSVAILKIYSISGVEYHEEQLYNSEPIHLDRSIFKNGIYIIKVFNDQFVKTTKLIVK